MEGGQLKSNCNSSTPIIFFLLKSCVQPVTYGFFPQPTPQPHLHFPTSQMKSKAHVVCAVDS